VTLLFGTAYQQAGSVLAVHIWAGIFVFLGVASANWFLIEGLQRYSFYRILSGAVVNVGLNLILIPKFGVIGAAWATVVSQAGANTFFNVFNSKTRPLFFMQCKSCFIIGSFSKRT
jgi:PST family polysaccharide transporter